MKPRRPSITKASALGAAFPGKNWPKAVPRFTIAHRLTTIRNATLILVLTKDGIAERGSHKELMAKKGIYYHLYKDSADLTEPAEETAE